jgi:hypothetical protein
VIEEIALWNTMGSDDALSVTITSWYEGRLHGALILLPCSCEAISTQYAFQCTTVIFLVVRELAPPTPVNLLKRFVL